MEWEKTAYAGIVAVMCCGSVLGQCVAAGCCNSALQQCVAAVCCSSVLQQKIHQVSGCEAENDSILRYR